MWPDRILLDIETQRDFFDPAGSLYAPGSARAYRQIKRLFKWSKTNKVPVISTVLRVRRDQIGLFGPLPHCVEGSDGEKKMPGTVLHRCINLGLRNVTDLPLGLFEHYQQIIFEKRVTDIFHHLRIERLITELNGSVTFIICGAGTAHGLIEAAVGLRSRGFPVVLVWDARAELDEPQVRMALLRMEAKGVVFAPTDKIIAIPVPRRRSAAFRRIMGAR